jgi:hypothetical protein
MIIFERVGCGGGTTFLDERVPPLTLTYDPLWHGQDRPRPLLFHYTLYGGAVKSNKGGGGQEQSLYLDK